jgi:magnesium-transporting ATPase (P-type)
MKINLKKNTSPPSRDLVVLAYFLSVMSAAICMYSNVFWRSPPLDSGAPNLNRPIHTKFDVLAFFVYFIIATILSFIPCWGLAVFVRKFKFKNLFFYASSGILLSELLAVVWLSITYKLSRYDFEADSLLTFGEQFINQAILWGISGLVAGIVFWAVAGRRFSPCEKELSSGD